jgi:hypothetical protein
VLLDDVEERRRLPLRGGIAAGRLGCYLKIALLAVFV